MKKISFILIEGIILGCLLGHARADTSVYDSGNVRYKQTVAANTISTSSVIISLSSSTDGSVYPHRFNRELQIRGVKIYVDKLAASTCTVKLGVVTYVDVSSGSVTYFTGVSNERNVSNTLNEQLYYLDNLAHNLHVDPLVPVTTVDGKTPYLLSNDTLSKSTAFNNTTAIPATSGVIIPKVGDLILTVSNGNAAVDVYIEVMYYGSF